MSMTDLKALGLSWFMGARKLPAAPALLRWGSVNNGYGRNEGTEFGRFGGLHYEIDTSESFDAFLYGVLEAFDTAHVNGSETEDFGAFACGGDVAGHSFGFFDVAADYAGVGAEMDHCSYLGAADRAGAAGAEYDFVVYEA